LVVEILNGKCFSFGEKISVQYLSELLGFDGVEKFIEFITASSNENFFIMVK